MKRILLLALLITAPLAARTVDILKGQYSWVQDAQLIQLTTAWAIFACPARTALTGQREFICVKRETVDVRIKGQYIGQFQEVRQLHILLVEPGETVDGFPVTMVYCEAITGGDD